MDLGPKVFLVWKTRKMAFKEC